MARSRRKSAPARKSKAPRIDRLSTLPPEILLEIFSLLYPTRYIHNILHCTTLNRALAPIAQQVLYSKIEETKVHDPQSYWMCEDTEPPIFPLLCRTLLEKPEIGRHIRTCILPDVDKTLEVSERNLRAIFASMTSVKEVHMSRCRLSALCLKTRFAEGCFKTMVTLKLDNPPLDMLSSLRHFPSLKTFTITLHTSPTIKKLPKFKDYPPLLSIDHVTIAILADAPFVRHHIHHFVRHLPNLKRFHLAVSGQTEDFSSDSDSEMGHDGSPGRAGHFDDFSSIVQALPSTLEYLRLQDHTEGTHEDINETFSHFTNLKHLYLYAAGSTTPFVSERIMDHLQVAVCPLSEFHFMCEHEKIPYKTFANLLRPGHEWYIPTLKNLNLFALWTTMTKERFQYDDYKQMLALAESRGVKLTFLCEPIMLGTSYWEIGDEFMMKFLSHQVPMTLEEEEARREHEAWYHFSDSDGYSDSEEEG